MTRDRLPRIGTGVLAVWCVVSVGYGRAAPRQEPSGAVGSSQGAAAERACDQSPLLIRNARVWAADGIRDARDLLVRDGVIERIAPAGQTAASGRRVLDARGMTVLPGLIDAHVHLDTLPGQLPAAMTREQMIAIAARQTLASGVTAARMHLSDAVTGPILSRSAMSPCHPGPRLSMGGPGLMGGNPTLSARLMRGVADADQGRRLVREVARQGFEWLALHDVHRFDRPTLRAIVDEARRASLRLMASADQFADVEIALEMRVDSLEYLNRTTAPGYPAALLEQVGHQRGRLVIVPPIGYYTRYRDYRETPTAASRAAHVRLYPPAVGEALLSAVEQHFRAAAPNDIDQSFGTLATKFRELRGTGVPMAIGSDSGSPGQFHVDAIWHEMRAWRGLGIPAREVLIAATATPARLVGGRAGSLEVGGRADLVLYRGDVLDGDFDPGRVRTVVKGGVIFVDDYRWVGPPVPVAN